VIRLQAYLRGVGLWTPDMSSFADWVGAGLPANPTNPADPAAQVGAPDAKAQRPPAALLHSRLRRRTSTLTRAAVTAMEEAAAQGGARIEAARFVLVSGYGEIQTTMEILEQIVAPEGLVSPTRFHNSVHNTATGYMSIASGNHRGSTALAAGPQGLEVGLLEVMAGLAVDTREGEDCEVRDAILVLCEERLPPPFDHSEAGQTYALALHFSTRAGRPEHPDSLDMTLEIEVGASGAGESRVGEGAPGYGARSMLTSMLPLMHAVAELDDGAREQGTRRLALSARPEPGVIQAWFATLRAHARDSGEGN